jgi:hypothetical protein
MNSEELKKIKESLEVFGKFYDGIILSEEEINIVLKTSEETIIIISEIIRQENLRKIQDGSLEIYISNKNYINNLKIEYKTNFDESKYEKEIDENISFDIRLEIFAKYYNGKILTPLENKIIARTSSVEVQKIDEIIRRKALKARSDGSYLRYIRNCACLSKKKNSFDNPPVKKNVYSQK